MADELPPYMKPLFMSGGSQKIFDCVCDEQVTEENPHILISKAKIMEDFKMRAAVCDFHPIKKQITSYPGEEILIVYDPDYKYGENFYVCLTEAGKAEYLDSLKKEEEEAEEEATAEAEAESEEYDEIALEDIILKDLPSTPATWQEQGSEEDLEEEILTTSRSLITFMIQRKRKMFGTPTQFEDRNVDAAKDAYIECTSFEDNTFDLHRQEHDFAVQNVMESCEKACQTEWKKPRTALSQYVPRTLPPAQLEKINKSEDLAKFVESVCPRFKLALQQNEIMDVFADDYNDLIDVDGVFGNKADNNLKEYQSFTDLEFSKNKSIAQIDWHPSIKGIVAVAYTEKLKYDDRVDLSSRILMTPSLILIWGFSDPIHPQLVLEAPEDIYTFKFNPTDPNIVAAGCINGQVVMWDISQYDARLRNHKNTGARANKTRSDLFDVEYQRSPVVHYAAVSSIEGSHKMAVMDLMWLPDTIEVARMGVPVENKAQASCQLVTVGIDGNVMFWDIRLQKPAGTGGLGGLGSTTKKERETAKEKFSSIPSTFSHLDLQWKPINVVPLSKLTGPGLHPGVTLSISQQLLIVKSKMQSLVSGNPPLIHRTNSSVSRQRPVEAEGVNTKFFAGTEDGYLIYTDWKAEKDPESGKLVSSKPVYAISTHAGPVHCLLRSPFYNHIFMSVGGWSWSIWKEGESEILQTSRSNVKYTAASWSLTRPGVFYIGKEDGNIDVWDLMDRSHEPSMSQNISSSAVTSLVPYRVSSKQVLLGVGDNFGTLHILEVPWSLRQASPNELHAMSSYFDRECSRIDYYKERDMNRGTAVVDSAPQIPTALETAEEEEERLKKSFNNYLNMEKEFLVKLGLRKEDDPVQLLT
ncbi:dynein axonemal intermediate chain 3-like [Bolinopsis microptera]|uniref:dynein axonemal intermediate chain 3-like n=1 Tax=Bolinopsis microptera TaxID=2820187 RepID=UPI00307AFD99